VTAPAQVASERPLSVAMTATTDRALAAHLDKGPRQEDLLFAYWRPSEGETRTTAVIKELVLPRERERILQGNVAFTNEYLQRVLAERPEGAGIALLHSHLGPGWQGMSHDDVVAERDRLAGAVWGRSGLPVLGLTWATDGFWSARVWQRTAPRAFERREIGSVRVVGRAVRISYHPGVIAPRATASQVRTLSVWGKRAQEQLARARVGVVGLGSVGSIIAEGLARVGFTRISLIDFDVIEERNRDRTSGATAADVAADLTKVQVAARNVVGAATGEDLDLRVVPHSLLDPEGLSAALDCDAIVCCVDRPWPRFVLNSIAYSHLIPVVDGGIAAYVKPDGTPLHVSWRIHTVGPDNACMVCQDALRRSDIALDKEGRLDDPDYIQGLPPADQARFTGRNVYPFSLSVASHELLQIVGLLTGFERIGGTGPQSYQGYPGKMRVAHPECDEHCEFAALTATAVDQTANIRTRGA
jgi:tRNA A37 threonylcarbamoyladenosine dehydratase